MLWKIYKPKRAFDFHVNDRVEDFYNLLYNYFFKKERPYTV